MTSAVVRRGTSIITAVCSLVFRFEVCVSLSKSFEDAAAPSPTEDCYIKLQKLIKDKSFVNPVMGFKMCKAEFSLATVLSCVYRQFAFMEKTDFLISVTWEVSLTLIVLTLLHICSLLILEKFSSVLF